MNTQKDLNSGSNDMHRMNNAQKDLNSGSNETHRMTMHKRILTLDQMSASAVNMITIENETTHAHGYRKVEPWAQCPTLLTSRGNEIHGLWTASQTQCSWFNL